MAFTRSGVRSPLSPPIKPAETLAFSLDCRPSDVSAGSRSPRPRACGGSRARTRAGARAAAPTRASAGPLACGASVHRCIGASVRLVGGASVPRAQRGTGQAAATLCGPRRGGGADREHHEDVLDVAVAEQPPDAALGIVV